MPVKSEGQARIALQAPGAVLGRSKRRLLREAEQSGLASVVHLDSAVRADTISGVHCAIVWKEGTWQLQDKGALNGTMVNGVRVAAAVLEPGDVLSLGMCHGIEVGKGFTKDPMLHLTHDLVYRFQPYLSKRLCRIKP